MSFSHKTFTQLFLISINCWLVARVSLATADITVSDEILVSQINTQLFKMK